MYLRQIAIVAGSRDPVVDALRNILGLEVCFVDEEVAEFGLENALLALGSQFVEVVAPVRPGTAAGRYLERRSGDGGYMVITQVMSEQEQTECRERACAEGVRVAWEKEHADGRYMQLHPRDTGGCFLEIDYVEACDPEGHWPPAGGDAWRGSSGRPLVDGITAVDVQAADPAALAGRWSAITGVPVDAGDNGNCSMNLKNATVRFVPVADKRGEGLAAIELRANDARAIRKRADAFDALDADGTPVIGGVRIGLC